MRFILTLIATSLVLSASAARTGTENTNPTLVYPPWKHTLGLRRVGQKHLDFYSGYRKTFVRPQGMATVKLAFNDAEGPGDDEELTIYGVNSGSGEIFYNKSMVSAGFFGKVGAGPGEFKDPIGVGADRWGNVVVADTGNRRVVVLRNRDNEIEFKRSFRTSDGNGVEGIPTGIALEDSTVYVADRGLDRVVATSLDGAEVGVFGKGLLIDPFGIAVIRLPEWNYYGSEFIVVTDSLNQRLVGFGPGGEVARIRRHDEISGDEGGFNFVAIDYYGNVYVTDTVAGCIYKFDRFLNYVTRVGCGTGTKEDLVEPRGIAIHRRFGQLFVAEKEGASYYWIGTDIKRLRCNASVHNETIAIEIEFNLTEHSEVTMSIENADGEPVLLLLDRRVIGLGPYRDVFSIAVGDLPCSIANCIYYVSVEARATYSSKRYHTVKKSAPIRRE